MYPRDKNGRFLKDIKRGKLPNKTKIAISISNTGKRNGMWSGGKIRGICRKCSKLFYYWPRQQKGFYCSCKCCNSSRIPIWLHTPESKYKARIKLLERLSHEATHPRWKGAKAGYVSLHKWVYKHKGKPKKCSFCGLIKGKRLEWANKSNKYKRNLDDWIELCASCHRKYDFKQRIEKADNNFKL